MTDHKEMLSRAQKLRKNMTKEENILWYQFLRRYPLQFRRQYLVGNYIVDFYCYKARLVVELDGSQHRDPAGQEYDQVRTNFLEEQGLYVLRISNLDIQRNFRSVCEMIDRIAMTRSKALG